ncbi:MAG TPA: TetR/AcrR family transcriptional regulator, partial [Actinomycetaceae bacterium]|nr:TetR/AcrR family transcriptional regulator [Actinomycetaceae bacterium]
RAGFVASQLFGLAVVRYLLRFEPIASAPRDSVRRTVGPTLQSYLTGPVDDLPEAAPGPE